MPSNRPAALLSSAQEWTLYAFLVLLPFSKAAVEIAFVFLLAAWLMERFVPAFRRPTVWTRPGTSRIGVAGLTFFAASALSIAGSKFPTQSIEGLIGKWAEYLLFLVILADVGGRPRVMRRSCAALTVAAALVVLEAFWQELTGKGLLRGYPLTIYARMTGPYENPIDLATFFMVAFPALLASWISQRGRARWSIGVVLLLVAVCLGRTEATGAWLGLLAGLAVMMAKEPRVRRYGLAAVAALVIVAAFWLRAMGRLDTTFSPTEAGTSDRWVMWQAALGMIADRPLLGHGVNTFMSNYLDYWVGGERMPRYAHNCYLQVAAETGLVGLAAFVALLGLVWSRIWRSLRRPLAGDALMRLGVLGGLTAFLLQGAIDTNFYALRQAALFWALSGVALGASYSPKEA
jgi:putative inorganic carbon (HCO3(-)) transporter